jgi:[ribosomal protein S5]-alanine N-acetyltransferase
MKRQLVLRTPRLEIQPVRRDNLSDLQALWNAPLVRQFLFDGEEVTLAVAAQLLQESLGRSACGLALWRVHLRDAGQGEGCVGCIGLHPVSVAAETEPRLAGLIEPIAALSPFHWGKGYATEAVAALLDYAFDELRLLDLAAVNDQPNLASARMLKRLGFRPLSVVPGPKLLLQTYLLTRAQWQARRKAPLDHSPLSDA